MPYLNEQVTVLNQELQKVALADARFTSGRFEAIANEAVRDGKTFPIIIGQLNESTINPPTPDDTYPIVIYHKVLNKSYDVNNIGGKRSEFGDRNKYVVETVNMKMVVYAKWLSVRMTKEQLEALITTNFPDNMDNADNALLASLKLDNVTFAMKGANFLSKNVWADEYQGTAFMLAPEDIFFSINYTIQSTFRKSCFKLCDCN